LIYRGSDKGRICAAFTWRGPFLLEASVGLARCSPSTALRAVPVPCCAGEGCHHRQNWPLTADRNRLIICLVVAHPASTGVPGASSAFRRSGRPWTQISRRVTGLWMLLKRDENANARQATRGGNSLFCTKLSLFFIGTGKACQGADLVWQSDRAGHFGGRNQSKIVKIPCYLPCFQGNQRPRYR
jgi:hypothetical protein